MRKLIAIILLSAFLVMPFSVGSVVGDDGRGTMTDQSPYATGTSVNHIHPSNNEYDNSGSDVLTLYFTFKDNNSEADISIGAGDELILYYEGSAENDGYEVGDIMVKAWDLSLTQVAGDCWIDDNGGATNASNDDGTTTDGYFEIEDENDNDDNFEYTIIGSTPTSNYYAVQINFSDEGANVESWSTNFAIISSVTYTLVYANGNWGPTYWGEWSQAPTDSAAPDDPDAVTIGWLLINNTGSDPAQQFTVSFSAENFTGDTYARWINIDYNVRWTFYEVDEVPGGAFDPDDVAYEDTNWTTADDADGDYTFTFTYIGSNMWVIYELAQVTEDDGVDTTPVVGHNYDNVLRDDTYSVTFTVTAI